MAQCEVSPQSMARHHDGAQPGHDLRGVSVFHLQGGLLERMKAAGHDMSAKVCEIEPTVIRPAGADLVCPRDYEVGCAYVDYLDDDNDAGLSTHMLSYSWSYVVRDIGDALSNFCSMQQLDPKRTYVWICCLCVNQHRVKAAIAKGATVPFEDFKEAFSKRVLSVPGFLALMAPWEAPMYVTRVWCVFEMYTAISTGMKVTVLMPPSESRRLADEMTGGHGQAGLTAVWQTLMQIDVSKAQASVENDRVQIMRLVAEGPGTDNINREVSSYLKAWFLDASEQELRKLIATGIDKTSLANICCRVGDLMRKSGMFDRAMAVLSEGQRLALPADGEETVEGAALMMTIGNVKRNKGDMDGAMQAYLYAERIHKHTQTTESLNYAAVLRNIGTIKEKSNDCQGALEAYDAATAIHVATNTLETSDGTSTLRDTGTALMRFGYNTRAMEVLQKAKVISEKLAILKSPDGSLILLDLARLIAEDQVQESLELYEQAIDIRSRTGTLVSVDDAETLVTVASLHERTGNLTGTDSELQSCLRKLWRSSRDEVAT